MRSIVMHDVGDGSHIDILHPPLGQHQLKVDFGTSSDISKLLDSVGSPFPSYVYNSFLLSHFHTDHYSGLVEILKNPKYSHSVQD
jgi:beta-lactamase superfamily II metal-dependent hydrolase